jgi:elongation factor P--(R)-beta-lysine ligase
MLARARDHFARQGVIEVETPVLSQAAVSDLHLGSVPADVAGVGRMYLQTSPEYAMKRLLAAGLGDCYQVCRVFRDGERGRQHNPEFTLIEWYRCGFDAAALMADVETLVRGLLAPHRALAPFSRVTYREALQACAGVDPLQADAGQLAAALQRHAVALPAGHTPAARDELLDLLVSAVVGPALGRDSGTFLHDYPASQAALARLKPGDPTVAERFELYLDGVELANGYHELTDAVEQRRRFNGDLAERERLGLPRQPVDERMLAALAHGLPDCAGVALGFDRLVMTGLSLGSIAEAMAFPAEIA